MSKGHPPLNGAILLQARSLPKIVEIANLGRGASGRAPDKSQLEAFLGFLGTVALARGFKFDNTVPATARGRFLKSAEELGLADDLAELKPAIGDEFIRETTDAAAMAAGSFARTFSAALAASAEKIAAADRHAFFATVDKMRKERRSAHRQEIALGAFNKNVMGAKCLIGLSAPKNEATFRQIVGARGRSPDDAIMSAAINCFRPFYLSVTASRDRAILSTEAKDVGELQRHRLALWSAIERELLTRRYALAPAFKDEALSVPMIGAAILTQAKDTSPYGLIRAAKEAGTSLGINSLAQTLWNCERAGGNEDPAKLAERTSREIWEAIAKVDPHTALAPATMWNKVAVAAVPRLTVGVFTASATVKAGGDPLTAAVVGLGSITISSLFDALAAVKKNTVSARTAACVANLARLHEEAFVALGPKAEAVWCGKRY